MPLTQKILLLGLAPTLLTPYFSSQCLAFDSLPPLLTFIDLDICVGGILSFLEQHRFIYLPSILVSLKSSFSCVANALIRNLHNDSDCFFQSLKSRQYVMSEFQELVYTNQFQSCLTLPKD